MTVRRRSTNAGDYGYPISDKEALAQKALEVTHRLTEQDTISSLTVVPCAKQ